MALSTLEYIRLLLSLPRRTALNETIGEGDGVTTRFKTQLIPIIAESEAITVNGVAQTRDVDYTIDNELGLVTFTAAPDAEAVVDADYTWSVFSDVSIEGLLEHHNQSVVRTAIDLIRAMLANSDLFLKYTLGVDSVDRSSALDSLKALLEDFKADSSASLAQAVIWTASDVEDTGKDVPWEPFLEGSIPEDLP